MPMIRNGNPERGKRNVLWAELHMGALMTVRERFAQEKPLKGKVIGCCLHVTKETAALVRTLTVGGARVCLAASNPLSTNDDVAAFLVSEGIEVFAFRGQNEKEYWECIDQVINANPSLTIDDGADLTTRLHEQGKADALIGGTEETTTGVIRLRALERAGKLRYPVIAVNDAQTKMMFDNRYGTGQSTIDGILRASGILLAGKTVVVAGYGWCGKGCALRAKGMGARVIVTEVHPIRALEAYMDGLSVMPMKEAARLGDVFITVTGNTNVITTDHMRIMKHGAILCNAGHFDVEIDVKGLKQIAVRTNEIRPHMQEYVVRGEDGKERSLFLLGEGRLVNLAAAEGHPSEVMQMSFANQALAAEYLIKNHRTLTPRVYDVPREIDESVARAALNALNVSIDDLTPEQQKYLQSY